MKRRNKFFLKHRWGIFRYLNCLLCWFNQLFSFVIEVWDTDNVKVLIEPTEKAIKIFKNAPPLLQEEFISAFHKLDAWEQTLMLSTLQRIGTMMDAKNIIVSPILETISE